MEEIEVPTEHLSEEIEEKLEEAREERREKSERWTMYLAISTALFAVFAALGSLFAGHHSNEALISQIKASDTWSYYQAKGIKSQITSLREELLSGKEGNSPELKSKLDQYKKEQDDLRIEAKKAEEESELHLDRHVTLARSVTIFQISIAISAIAMLTRRKFLWYGSVIFSLLGLVLFIIGMR